MRVRKAIKRIAALGTGLTLAGATLFGALAADLSDYPSPFVRDGVFDAVIVVGDKAAAEDVVGAIDIGASLQFALAQPAAIVGGGAARLEGDVVEIGEPSDILEIGERIGDVRETLTDAFLDALRSGIITTDEGTTDYNQFLRFEKNATDEWINIGTIPSGKVQFDEDEDDVVGHYLYFKDSDTIFEYEIEFEEGVESEIEFKSGTSGPRELDDLEDEQVVMLGEVYTIVDTLFQPGTGGLSTVKIKLEMIGGDVVDTLEEGECKNYNLDGVDYEVCVVIISDNKNDGEGTVKFNVNGEITDEMEDGETEVLRDGTQIGVRDILPNEAEEVSGGDIVEFFLGANEIEFTDANYSDNAFDQGGVEVGEEDIEDGAVMISGQNFTGDIAEITSIQYRLEADALKGDVYVRPGHGLREFLDEPQGMLNNNWDIVYEGLQDTGVSIIKFDAAGDDSYTLKFTSREGLDYVVPLIDNSNDDNEGFKFGDEDDELYFRECADKNSTSTVGPNAIFCIREDDMFVLTDDNDETGFTHVMVYESVDTSNFEVTFTDLGTGQREITYDTSNNADVGGLTGGSNSTGGGKGELVVGGNTFIVYVGNQTNNYSLAVDLNNNGRIDDDDEARIVVDGGGVLDLGNQCTNALLAASGNPVASNSTLGQQVQGASSQEDCTAVTSVAMTLTTLSTEFDERGPFNVAHDENITINITQRATNEVDLNVLNAFVCASETGLTGYNVSTGVASCASGVRFDVLKMQSLQDEDIRQGLSTYGIFFEQTDEDDTNDADELTIEYPLFQRGAVVYVTAGRVTTTPSVGEGQLVTLNQINVGAAKLASEVAGQEFSQNMILVGGPCINAAAAKLMGSNEPMCGADSGIEAGTAIVKLFENDGFVSLLVAGYEKADTRRATTVIANHRNYADDLVGDEVVVKGTSLTDIQVMSPT